MNSNSIHKQKLSNHLDSLTWNFITISINYMFNIELVIDVLKITTNWITNFDYPIGMDTPIALVNIGFLGFHANFHIFLW